MVSEFDFSSLIFIADLLKKDGKEALEKAAKFDPSTLRKVFGGYFDDTYS